MSEATKNRAGEPVRQSIPVTVDPLLREPARRQVTGLSQSSWYELMREGKAPKPVAIGLRAVAWKASDLKRWVDERTVKVAP